MPNETIDLKLTMSNEPTDVVVQQDHLGVTLTSNLMWQAHVLKINQKASKKLNMLKQMKFKLQRKGSFVQICCDIV